jgi:clan AA aspartic protease (TIGR02281 family)
MEKYVFLAPLALVLVSCGQTVWVKPGASQQEFTTDRYDCEKDARQSGYFGTGLLGAINMQNFFDNCMNAHGYYAQKGAAQGAQSQPLPAINTSQSPADQFGHYDDVTLCNAAIPQPPGPSWETSGPAADAAIVAQQRGLTFDNCRHLVDQLDDKSGPDNPPSTRTESVANSNEANDVKSATNPSVLIAMQNEGGAYVVPVEINGAITLKFLIDSGAADVNVPADVVLTLMRAGTIQKSDFLGTRTYTLADGSTVPSSTFRIKSLKVADKTVENVTGSVAPVKGELLLGQSFLKRFKSWSIDNTAHKLVLN